MTKILETLINVSYRIIYSLGFIILCLACFTLALGHVVNIYLVNQKTNPNLTTIIKETKQPIPSPKRLVVDDIEISESVYKTIDPLIVSNIVHQIVNSSYYNTFGTNSPLTNITLLHDQEKSVKTGWYLTADVDEYQSLYITFDYRNQKLKITCQYRFDKQSKEYTEF